MAKFASQFTGTRSCVIYIMNCTNVDPQFIDTVVKHELAHYIDYMVDGQSDNHGGHWKNIMLSWSQDPAAMLKSDDIPILCQYELGYLQ